MVGFQENFSTIEQQQLGLGGYPPSRNNTTTKVIVPSSDHVAEIVGRQGYKIKELRTQTNTYIKTPVRGEEPVFVITGQPDGVDAAERKIRQDADHFTEIRAVRRRGSQTPTSLQPGHVVVAVAVEQRYVGLVIGPKGSTIKNIQQETHTVILTPERNIQNPEFKIQGTVENVERAKAAIASHIQSRTTFDGNSPISCNSNNCAGGTILYANENPLQRCANSGCYSHNSINSVNNTNNTNNTNNINSTSLSLSGWADDNLFRRKDADDYAKKLLMLSMCNTGRIDEVGYDGLQQQYIIGCNNSFNAQLNNGLNTMLSSCRSSLSTMTDTFSRSCSLSDHTDHSSTPSEGYSPTVPYTSGMASPYSTNIWKSQEGSSCPASLALMQLDNFINGNNRDFADAPFNSVNQHIFSQPFKSAATARTDGSSGLNSAICSGSQRCSYNNLKPYQNFVTSPTGATYESSLSGGSIYNGSYASSGMQSSGFDSCGSSSPSPTDSIGMQMPWHARTCCVCRGHEAAVVELLPCRCHPLFCRDCAEIIFARGKGKINCPSCGQLSLRANLVRS